MKGCVNLNILNCLPETQFIDNALYYSPDKLKKHLEEIELYFNAAQSQEQSIKDKIIDKLLLYKLLQHKNNTPKDFYLYSNVEYLNIITHKAKKNEIEKLFFSHFSSLIEDSDFNEYTLRLIYMFFTKIELGQLQEIYNINSSLYYNIFIKNKDKGRKMIKKVYKDSNFIVETVPSCQYEFKSIHFNYLCFLFDETIKFKDKFYIIKLVNDEICRYMTYALQTVGSENNMCNYVIGELDYIEYFKKLKRSKCSNELLEYTYNLYKSLDENKLSGLLTFSEQRTLKSLDIDVFDENNFVNQFRKFIPSEKPEVPLFFEKNEKIYIEDILIINGFYSITSLARAKERNYLHGCLKCLSNEYLKMNKKDISADLLHFEKIIYSPLFLISADDEIETQNYIYSSSMLICSLIEKQLRMIVNDSIRFGTLGSYFENSSIKETIPELELEILRYVTFNFDNDGFSRDYRNKLAHLSGIEWNQMNYSMLIELSYCYLMLLVTMSS